MTQRKKSKDKKVTDSILKELEKKLGKETTDNKHFQSFVSALVQSEVKT